MATLATACVGESPPGAGAERVAEVVAERPDSPPASPRATIEPIAVAEAVPDRPPPSYADAWWDADRPCPPGASRKGAAPPKGTLVYCSTSNGVRHGPLTAFSKAGAMVVATRYDHGRKHGHESRWHDNGRLSHQGRFVEHERHGVWSSWYPDGKKAWYGEYRGGRQHGKWISWHRNGAIRSVVMHRMGLLHGPATRYHPNGNKLSEGAYEGGDPVGVFSHFADDGRRVRVEERSPSK